MSALRPGLTLRLRSEGEKAGSCATSHRTWVRFHHTVASEEGLTAVQQQFPRKAHGGFEFDLLQRALTGALSGQAQKLCMP